VPGCWLSLRALFAKTADALCRSLQKKGRTTFLSPFAAGWRRDPDNLTGLVYEQAAAGGQQDGRHERERPGRVGG
jgi:hypothetical protein